MVARARQIANGYGPGNCTLRQLHYRLVAEGVMANSPPMYRRLSARCAEARRRGDFPDLVDTLREVHVPPAWPGPPGRAVGPGGLADWDPVAGGTGRVRDVWVFQARCVRAFAATWVMRGLPRRRAAPAPPCFPGGWPTSTARCGRSSPPTWTRCSTPRCSRAGPREPDAATWTCCAPSTRSYACATRVRSAPCTAPPWVIRWTASTGCALPGQGRPTSPSRRAGSVSAPYGCESNRPLGQRGAPSGPRAPPVTMITQAPMATDLRCWKTCADLSEHVAERGLL